MQKPRRKSCQQYIAERAAANRDREIEQLFSQLEMDARRELLTGKDAAQRYTHETVRLTKTKQSA
jgi:hypothetical protein